jgi:hypothetical protein
MRQCDSDYPCEVWHQYFPGITAVFLLVFRILISAMKCPARNSLLGLGNPLNGESTVTAALCQVLLSCSTVMTTFPFLCPFQHTYEPQQSILKVQEGVAD